MNKKRASKKTFLVCAKELTKILIIIVCAFIITCSFLFVKPKKIKADGCSTEIVTNLDTGLQYCMPQSIFEGSDIKKVKYRAMIRSGRINQNDIDILSDLAKYENIQKQMLKDGITSSNWLDYLKNNQDRLETYMKGVFTGQTLRTTMSFFNYQLGQALGSNNPDLWQKELESIQNSSNKNYYTQRDNQSSTTTNNVVNQGDTNYYSTFNYNTNQVYYNNNYYTTNNYYYDFNTYTNTYEIDNSISFQITYNVDNTVVNLIQNGVTNTSTYYFKLPDGRNSYNLTADQINGLKVDLNVSNYDIVNNNNDLLALYHLNSNKNNSALHNQSVNSSSGSTYSGILMYYGLPDGYTQVNYIRSNGNQYIDTGVKINDRYRYVLSYRVNNISSGGYFFGAWNTTNNSRIALFRNNNNIGDYLFSGYGPDYSFSNFSYSVVDNSTLDSNYIQTVYCNNQLIRKNNTNYSNFRVPNLNLYMFAVNKDNVAENKSVADIMYLRIYNSVGELTNYFIPCYRNSDNVLGFYDVITNNFKSNNGTGNFSYGSVVNPPSYYDSDDYLFQVQPNTISYLNDNSNFDEYLYIGQGRHKINIDLTSEGKTIDFRFYPVNNNKFNLSLGSISANIYEGNVVTYLQSESTTNNSTIISYSNYYLGTQSPTANSTLIEYAFPCGDGSRINYYASKTGQKFDNKDQYSTSWSCEYPNSSTTIANLPSNETFLVYNDLADYLNFGQWNHIALQIGSNGKVYLFINGKYIDSYNRSDVLNGNVLSIDLQSNYYSYIDEIRITKSTKYLASNYVNGLSFIPPSLPYDSNAVYVLPDNALSGQMLIQSMIPVNNWQFGGVRPSNVSKGDVYVNITDLGLLNSLQQYDGVDWVNVKGAIYDESLNLWVSYYGYSIYTNNWEYNDLTEMNPSDIQSDTDYYSWLGAWFSKITKGIDDIKLSITNSFNNVFNNEGDQITENLITNYDVDVNNTITNNIDDLININNDIDLQNYNIGTDLINAVNEWGRLVPETLNIFNNNGLGFMIIIPIIILIIGVIL